MKHLKILILLLILPLFTFTSDSDTRFVWAKSGLTLRDAPNMQGKKITVVPYSATVKLMKNGGEGIQGEVEEFPGFMMKGNWVRVQYQGKIGYLFDGYLGTFQPLPAKTNLVQYWDDVFQTTNQSQEILLEGVSEIRKRHMVYQNGSTVTNYAPLKEGNERFTFKIPKSLMSKEQVYLFIYAAVLNADITPPGEDLIIQKTINSAGTIRLRGQESYALDVTLKESRDVYYVKGMFLGC